MGVKQAVYLYGSSRLADILAATDELFFTDEAPGVMKIQLRDIDQSVVSCAGYKVGKSKSKHRRRAEKYPSFKQR